MMKSHDYTNKAGDPRMGEELTEDCYPNIQSGDPHPYLGSAGWHEIDILPTKNDQADEESSPSRYSLEGHHESLPIAVRNPFREKAT
jgi:hypothetical protein